MRLIHISDNHGAFIPLSGKYDAILHTGDLFPDSKLIHLRISAINSQHQLDWLRQNTLKFKEWIGNKTFLFVLGNHDFIDPDLLVEEFNKMNIKAMSLHDKIVTFDSINFYGFPYIPIIDQVWNYECSLTEMQARIDIMVDVLNAHYVDVLACHCPPAGILSGRYGNTSLTAAINYKIKPEMMPQTICFGHVHEESGLTNINGTLYSNAATTSHILTI